MEQGTFQLFLGVMSIIALFVFIALYFVKAGYGMFRTASWGISINNKLAWMLMEAPVFIVMLLLWWNSARYNSIVPLIFFLLFQLHYFQRAFVFPFLLMLWVLDRTQDPHRAGGCSRSWLERPLLSVTAITRRNGAVGQLVDHTVVREELATATT